MRYVRSIICRIIVGVKFATAAIFPVYALSFIFRRKREHKLELMFVFMAIFMIVPIILASFRTSFSRGTFWTYFLLLLWSQPIILRLFRALSYRCLRYLNICRFYITGNWTIRFVDSCFGWQPVQSFIFVLTAGWYVKKMIK